MKEIWGHSLWLYHGHFLLSYSCFLIFFFLFIGLHLLFFFFFSFILAINYHYGIQSSAFLQFKNSFLLPYDNSISFHRDLFFWLRRITFVILFHGIQSFAETYSWINGTNFCPWNKVTCDNMSDHHVIALQKIRLSAAF